MKKAIALTFLLLVPLMFGEARADTKKTFNGSVTGTLIDTLRVSFSLTNPMTMRHASSAWNHMVGVIKVPGFTGVNTVDSLGKRDTAIITLLATGLGGLRVDTIQTDTLVVLRGRPEITYNISNLGVIATHYSLDSGVVAKDSGTWHSTLALPANDHFSLFLDVLTFDIYMTDSVITTNDTVTYNVSYFFELIKED